MKSASAERPFRIWNFAAGRLLRLSLAALSLLLADAAVRAEAPYLAPGRPDGVALLAPPPVAGSEEAMADLKSTRGVFDGRTPSQEAAAVKSSGLSFDLFRPAIGDSFDLSKLPRTQALLLKVKKDINSAIDTPKDFWKRSRPYKLDSHLSLGNPEPSFSYPSGHSTRGTVYALVLSELFPDKREEILAVGRQIGWDRVLIGKHFPTDVNAGRVLGKAIFRELMASREFQRDLEVVKVEVRAAQGQQVRR